MSMQTTLSNPPITHNRAQIFANLSWRMKLIVIFLVLTAVSGSVIAFFMDRSIRVQLINYAGQSLKAEVLAKAFSVGDLIDVEKDKLQAFGLSKIVQDKAEEVS